MPSYLQYVQQYDIAISAILDTYKEGNHQGLPIIRFSNFLQNAPEADRCRFFISASAPAKEIFTRLQQYYPSENIFFVDYAFQLGFEGISLTEYRNYLASNWNTVETLYDCLADERSRKTLLNILKEHISGDPAWLQDTVDPDLDYPKDVIFLSDGEIFVEPGANDGSTFLDFTRRCPGYKTAYLFELEPLFQEKLQKIAEQEEKRGKVVHIIPKGTWNEETPLCFLSTGERTGRFVQKKGNGSIISLKTTTVDMVVVEPFTFMKMDIEGSEMNTLRGAERHIRLNRSKLGVSIYHKPTDLPDVWQYLHSLVPDYRFYLPYIPLG